MAGPGIFVHSRMPDGAVILTAKPIAGRGAEGERRNPGQDDLDAADVLDLDSWPGTDTSLGHLTVRNPARGHARERCGEADIRDQTPRPQEDTAARSAHPSPRITLSDEAADRERAHSRRYGRHDQSPLPATTPRPNGRYVLARSALPASLRRRRFGREDLVKRGIDGGSRWRQGVHGPQQRGGRRE